MGDTSSSPFGVVEGFGLLNLRLLLVVGCESQNLIFNLFSSLCGLMVYLGFRA